MPTLHPGCGYPTQFAAKIIAVCDLIFGLIGIFWFVYILEGYGILMEDPSIYNPNNRVTNSPPVNVMALPTASPTINLSPETLKNSSDPSIANHSFISLSDDGIQINGQTSKILLSGFYTVVNLVAFVLLLSGAHQRNILKLKIWFAIRLTVFLFKIVLYSIYLCIGAAIFSQVPHIIFMVVHLYGLWVVFVLIKEIRIEEELKARSSAGPMDSASVTGYTNFYNTAEDKA